MQHGAEEQVAGAVEQAPGATMSFSHPARILRSSEFLFTPSMVMYYKPSKFLYYCGRSRSSCSPTFAIYSMIARAKEMTRKEMATPPLFR